MHNGSTVAQAWMSNLQGCSVATKQMVRDCIASGGKLSDLTQRMCESTLAAKAGNLALRAFATAANMAFMMGVSALISGLYQLTTLSHTVADGASEAANVFSTAEKDITEYKKQIDDLYKVINDSGSSVEQVTSARESLLQVQDEMIEKFGTEAGVIDIVTRAINNQTDALDELTSKSWTEALDSFNAKGGFIGKLANAFGRGGHHSNVETMQDEYGNATADIRTATFRGLMDKEQYQRFLDIAKSLGAELSKTEKGSELLSIKGNADEVYNTLLDIQNVAKDMQLPDKVSDTFGTYASKAKEARDEYKAFYEQYTQQEKILSTSGKEAGYDDIYKSLVDQKAKIDEAFKAGDDEAREEAIQEYASILSDAMAKAANDEDVKDYFHNMYPEIQSEVDTWRFKVKFEANADDLKGNVQEYIKVFTDKDYSAEDIEEFDRANSIDPELNEAYDGLTKSLRVYNLEVQDIIPWLEELNIVQNRAQQLLSKKFSKDQVAKLSPEDLEIVKGFSQDAIDSMESWDDLIKKIEEAKLAAQNAAAEISSARKLKDINADKSGIDGLFSKYENTEGQLSQDDVASILEANPEYIQYLIKVGDQYKLNKQALEDWNAVNKEQELAIDNQMGGNKYLESYDSVLSDIANPASHGNGDGVGGTGISEQLDDLIAKNKELNNSFLNGEITASEYFSNLSGYITSSGLEDALHSLNGEFDDTTDYIEETVSVLSTELSDALLQSNKRFLKGETSVSQYIDELQAGTDAQKKLLSSTYNLKANSSGLVEITDDMSESTKNAAESYNDLVKSQSGLEGASGLADVLQENADFLSQYTDEAGNLMDSIFQDNQFDSYVSSMSDQIATFAQSSIENMSSTAEWLSETAGISLQEATDIVTQGGNAIQDTVGDSLTGVGSMTNFAMTSIGGAVSNASTAIGGVLSALGEMISSFNYKIEAHATVTTPPHISKGENGLPELDLGTYGLEFTGSGGESVKDFSTALTNAGSYFTKTGTEQANARIMDLNSYKSNNNSNTAGGYRPTYKGKSGGSGGGKGGSGSGSGSEKDPTEFDWIERKLNVLNDQIDNTKSNIEELVGYKSKNAETDTAIDLMTKKLGVLQDMHKAYMDEADKIGLSDDYIDKIKNGGLDIEKISDENVAKQVKNYQDLYDKAQDCEDQIKEVTKSIKEMNLSELDNIIDQFSQTIDVLSKPIDTQLQILDWHKASDTMEVVADDYIALGEAQMRIAQENQNAYDELSKKMKNLNLKEGSEEWKKYNDQLIEYKNNMVAAAQAVEDYKDKMKELVYKELDDYKSKMDSINNTISTMTDLIGDTKLVDDTGNLTDRGLAQMALYAQQLANAKQEAAEYDEAIKSLDEALDSGLLTQDEYKEKLYDYQSSQESAVKATKDARDAIISLAKEGIQAEIDARKEQTDAAIEALEAEKDLHDYTDSINEKQKNITTLQKKIAALSGATSGAELAQRLQLEKDLADAQKDLYDTQYDHNIEQQKNALNDAYDAYEKEKNDEMDELDSNLEAQEKAIKKYLSEVKANYKTAYNVLTKYGDEYNVTAIEDLTTPWESGSNAANICADAIGDAVAIINYEISSIDISPLQELIEAMQQLADYGIAGSGGGSGAFEDISDQGSWHKGSGGRWWFGDGDDYASDGVYTINGAQYGFGKDGYMMTGWNDESGDWRYFQEKGDDIGKMVKSDWVQDSKKKNWYYVGADGAMLTNKAVKDKKKDVYYYLDDDGKWDGKELTYEQIKKLGYSVGYRKGTKSSTPGVHPVGEDGPEFIISNNGTAMVTPNGGDMVFTKDMSGKLFDFSKNPVGFMDDLKKQTIADIPMINNAVTQSIPINVVVQGNADQNTINAMKGMLQTEMKKYATGSMFRDIQKAGRGYR